MFNKVYEKIKDLISKNYIFLITLLVACVISTIQFPYYINAPGGLINVTDKIEIDGEEKATGSFNLAYVSEYKATIPLLLYSWIDQDWNILKREEVAYSNETIEEANFRNHILLEEANQNAVIVAYRKANKNMTIKNKKVYVTYIDEDAETDLKIGDEILALGNQTITSKEELLKGLTTHKVEDTVYFKVKNKNKISNKKATLKEVDNKVIIGTMISEQKEFEVSPNIKLHFEPSESGPSGGFMMSLAIYDTLMHTDLTAGRVIVGTGTIDLEGNVGQIGGVAYKLKGAVKKKAEVFLVPAGENYEEAISLKKERDYQIEIIKIHTLDEAISYLEQSK